MERGFLFEKLKNIYELLIIKYKDEENVGVLGGLGGIAMFIFYYSKIMDNDEDIKNEGLKVLERAISMINNGYQNPPFSVGIAGFVWTLDHLEKEGFVEIGCDELLPEFDNYLFDMMMLDMKNGNYDFLTGGIGYAYYFLSRYENTKIKMRKKKYEDFIMQFIKLLNDISIVDGANLKLVMEMSFNKQKVYNLGLSHGMASIVGILTKLCQHDIFKQKATFLLTGAINYILSVKNSDFASTYLFPKFVNADGDFNYHGRLAWCYSDLGIALRLWHAGEMLEEDKLKDTANSVLNHIAGHRSPKEHGVVDAGFCHGSFGNAHIFRSIGKKTNIAPIQDAGEFWMYDGLSKGKHLDGYAGYKQWNSIENNWYVTTGLLEGVSGIGLVIIDYLGYFDSSWDECLMIS